MPVKVKKKRAVVEEDDKNRYPFQDEFDEAEALEHRIRTWDDAINEVVTDEMRAEDPEIDQTLRHVTTRLQEVAGKDLQELDDVFNHGRFWKPKLKKMEESPWNDEEADEDYLTEEGAEKDFAGEDMTSMAHGKLEEIREQRHYARITAWEMPLLASEYTKPSPGRRTKLTRH